MSLGKADIRAATAKSPQIAQTIYYGYQGGSSDYRVAVQH